MKMRIGTRLLAIRNERGLTQADIAHLLDIPESTYAHYERNESLVDYQKMGEFAKKLNVSVQDLLPENVSINNNNNNSGQGGGMIFGNQYFYLGDNAVNKALSEENQMLKDRLNNLETALQSLMNKENKQ